MNSSLKYTVQIITDAEQLTEALNLRYRTYKKVYPKLTEKCILPFESDEFDARSIHLGFYCENGNEKKLAGYCRLILPEHFEKKFSDLLIIDHPEYLNNSTALPGKKLAMMERVSESNYRIIDSFCESLEEKKTIYIETSRFIVDEEHRSVSLSFFYVSSMLAIADSLNIGYVFFECQPHHISFYERFGFTLFNNMPVFDDPVLKVQQAIFGTDLNVANVKQSSIKNLKLQLEEENRITFRRAA